VSSLVSAGVVFSVLAEPHKKDIPTMVSEAAVIFIVGLGLYGATSLFSIASFLFTACRKSFVHGGVQKVTLARRMRVIFRTVLQLFLCTRLAWLAVHLLLQVEGGVDKQERSTATFVLNRFAFVLFFTAFCLVVFYWAEQYHKRYVETQAFLPQLGWTFILVNIAVYALQVVILIWYLTTSDDTASREGNVLYEANIVADVGLSAAVSIGFFVYGLLLFTLARSASLDPAAVRLGMIDWREGGYLSGVGRGLFDCVCLCFIDPLVLSCLAGGPRASYSPETRTHQALDHHFRHGWVLLASGRLLFVEVTYRGILP
jgi:THH1/TOM1/TOM3 domain